jgi:hypothetical protein
MIKMKGRLALLLVCTALAACGSKADEEACAAAQAKFSICGIGGLEQGCGDYSRCQVDCFNGTGCVQLKEGFFGPATELSEGFFACMTACGDPWRDGLGSPGPR